MIRDQARAEPRLLRRRETEKELRGVGDQVGARDAGRHRHPLRQALLAGEAAAREAAPHARHTEDVQLLEERLSSGGDVIEVVAPQ